MRCQTHILPLSLFNFGNPIWHHFHCPLCVVVCGQKTPFQGLSLLNAKGGVIAGNRRSFSISRRRFEVTARTAGSSKIIEVEVDKPLGVTLGQKPGGGVVITVSVVLLSSNSHTFHGF